MPPMQQNVAANFHGNFQAVGNRVDLQGTLFRLGNKSGYIEVEILNPQTGRTMCVIDKVVCFCCTHEWVSACVFFSPVVCLPRTGC